MDGRPIKTSPGERLKHGNTESADCRDRNPARHTHALHPPVNQISATPPPSSASRNPPTKTHKYPVPSFAQTPGLKKRQH